MDFGFEDDNITFVVYNSRPANHYTTNEMVKLCGYELPKMSYVDREGGLFLSKECRVNSAMYSRLTLYMNKMYFELFGEKPTKSNFKDKDILIDGTKSFNYSNVYPAHMCEYIHEWFEQFPISSWNK